MSVCLSPDELDEVLRFKPLPSPSNPGRRFGWDLIDYGPHDDLDGWFHEHHPRLLIDPRILQRLPHTMHAGPSASGIYFLFSNDILQYIGQSKNIRKRLHQHAWNTPDGMCFLRHAQWFNHYACIWVPDLYLDSVEAYYIHRYDPPRNDRLPPAYAPACDYLP